MRLIQFIKWWWGENDNFNRTLAAFIVLWLIPCLLAISLFGAKAMLALIVGILSTIVGWGLYGIFYWLRGLWQEFDRKNPSEDIEIINRLKGVSTTMHHDDYYD